MVFCLACNSVPENWHIGVNKGLTYLHIRLLWPNLGSVAPSRGTRYIGHENIDLTVYGVGHNGPDHCQKVRAPEKLAFVYVSSLSKFKIKNFS